MAQSVPGPITDYPVQATLEITFQDGRQKLIPITLPRRLRDQAGRIEVNRQINANVAAADADLIRSVRVIGPDFNWNLEWTMMVLVPVEDYDHGGPLPATHDLAMATKRTAEAIVQMNSNYDDDEDYFYEDNEHHCHCEDYCDDRHHHYHHYRKRFNYDYNYEYDGDEYYDDGEDYYDEYDEMDTEKASAQPHYNISGWNEPPPNIPPGLYYVYNGAPESYVDPSDASGVLYLPPVSEATHQQPQPPRSEDGK